METVDTELPIAPSLKCGRCQERKFPSEFYLNRFNTNGHDNYCKLCRGDADKKYRKAVSADPVKLERVRAHQKEYRAKSQDDREIGRLLKASVAPE